MSLLASGQCFADVSRECSSLFQSQGRMVSARSSAPSTVQELTTPKEVNSLLENPLKFEGKTLKFTDSLNNFPEPFHLRGVRKLPTWLASAVKDIQILARSPELREEVFGSSTSQKPFTTKPRKDPLNLASRDRGDEYPVVEVGLDVFTFSSGKRVYFYHTSNHPNRIVSDHEFYLSLMDTANALAKGQKIVALDSFHTHPIKLLISRDDRSFYQMQLQQIQLEHPGLSFENWTMSTTMEAEPVVHTVNLRDWLKR